MKKRIPFLKVLSETALISCGVLAAITVIPTAYGTPFNLLALVITEVILAFLLAFGINGVKRSWLIPCVIFAAGVLLFYLMAKETIAKGAEIAWYSPVRLLSLDFSFLPTPEAPPDVAFPASFVTEFLAFVASVLTLVIGILVTRCSSPIPALAVPLPAFIVGFIYTDCQPALYSAALLLIYWAGVLFGRELIKNEKPRNELGRAAFLVLLACLALLIPVISPRKQFNPIPFAERRGFLDTFGSVRDRLRSNRLRNPKEYELSKEGSREEDETKAFAVNCSRPGDYCLRTHSYGLYAGNLWKAVGDYPGRWNSLKALGTTQKGETAYLRIREFYTSERAAPYAFLPDEDVTVEEAFVRANGRSAYVWVFMPELEFEPVKRTSDEDRYYYFALDEYTLPNGGQYQRKMLDILDTLMSGPLWKEDADLPGGTPNLPLGFYINLDKDGPYKTALKVAELVRSSCRYDLNPGVPPPGRDFIEYFLLQNHRGYCVHFASATTALLQALGVPARYVVGYRVLIPEADVWYDVPINAAHAWTEVYIKGVGWVPVESSAGFPYDLGYGEVAPVETIAPEQTPAPNYTLPPNIDPPMPDNTPRPTRTPGERITRDPNVTPAPGSGGSRSSAWKIVLPSVIGAVILVWQAVGIVIRARRKRSFEQEDHKAAVIAMVKHMQSIRLYGAEKVPNAEELLNEAAFSNHDMKREQRELLRIVRRSARTVCRHKPLKRFALRWLLFKF